MFAVAALSSVLGGITAAPSQAATPPVVAGLSVPSSVSISSAAVTADISTSQAPSGASYTIAWGDGSQSVTTDPTKPVPHIYTRVGTFAVDLKVTAQGSSDETSASVAVAPVGGTLASSATSLVDHTPVTLSVTPPSQLGPGETVTAYNFGLTCVPGNGTAPDAAGAQKREAHPQTSTIKSTTDTGAAPSTTVTEPVYCIGQVLTSAEAILNDGGSFWINGPTLTVTAAPPVLAATVARTGPRTVQVDLAGSTVDAVVGSYPMFTIDWGDGTGTSAKGDLASASLHQNLPTHQYDSAGTKTITIWIGDGHGSSATTTRSIALNDPSVTAAVATVAGTDRYLTGIRASQQAFPTAGSANAVILARGDEFADALTGIPLADYRHGPLLVTPGGPSAKLDQRVATEIQRVLGPDTGKTVYLLGGTAALPQAVADYISNTLHYRVVRYAGTDRYSTALTIAKAGLGNPGRIVVARGDDFADALAAGPLAADKLADSSGKPAAIVLTQGPVETATVDVATADYIRAKETTPGAVTAVGGGAWAALTRSTFHGAGPITGIAGADRYGTAAAVAATWDTGTQSKITVGLATGTGFADALTGGALAALSGGPLLLTAPATLSPATAAYLHELRTSIATIDVFGGSNAIAPAVIDAIDQELYNTR
ncbi:cell wall-binding repeat-containing protein [Catenulispora pinistramenti]|uniref:cell wall-binding repeat-containing protein n=1 Tax=Catenulispora pinistramenti TaxID=2705254 RepID=UPI001BA8A0E9|nr:cell wall-binding repeat-containing protein [Catenulispora pinistramenti]